MNCSKQTGLIDVTDVYRNAHECATEGTVKHLQGSSWHGKVKEAHTDTQLYLRLSSRFQEVVLLLVLGFTYNYALSALGPGLGVILAIIVSGRYANCSCA